MKARKRREKLFCTVMIIMIIPILLPLIFMVMNSFMSPYEINRYYGSENVFSFHIVPDLLSLQSYYDVFLARPDYLVKFWNSIGITAATVAGQVIVSVFAGYAFAKLYFPFKDKLFFLFIIIMMMPYQVTLVSNYIVLDRMNLIGSYLSLIIPGIFAPFGVFLITQIFRTTNDEIIEAAKLDGAGHIQTLFGIIVPTNISGIISLVILSFIDNWNMVEQPLIFLKESSMYPLSVFLAKINTENVGLSFACGILALIPVTALYIFFKEELMDGINFSGIK